MKKIGFSLDKFKKISADQHKTVLQHPEGHQIVLANRAVAPKLRAQLAALPFADGGDVPDPDPKKAKEFSKGASESGFTPDKWIANMKEEFGISKPAPSPKAYAEGGDVQSSSAQDSPEQIAQDAQAQSSSPQQQSSSQAPVVVNVNASQPQQQPQIVPGAMGVGQLAGNAVRSAIQDPVGAAKFAASHSAFAVPLGVAQGLYHAGEGFAHGVTGTQPDMPPQAPEAPANNPPGAGQGTPPVTQPPTAGGNSDPYGNEAYYNAYGKGLAEQKAGITGEANAMAQESQEQAAALDKNVQTQQQAANDYKGHLSELTNEYHSFIQDVQNQHIDPQHYLNSLGTGGKISTAIGLILGGMGSGVTGGENPAMAVLQSRINADIDAQKQELGKKENLLNANLKQFGNLRDAADMTRVMQMGIVSDQLKAAAARAGTPLAKARALQAAGQLDAQAAPVLSQIAMRRTILSGMQNGQIDPSRVVEMFVPPDARPTARKELVEAQGMVKSRDNILNAFDQIAKKNTVLNRATSPIQSSREIAALRDPIIARLSKETAGRFTDSDAKMLSTLFPAAGDNDAIIRTKRAQMLKLITEKMNFPTLNAYGIDPNNTGRYRSAGGQSSIPESAPVFKK